MTTIHIDGDKSSPLFFFAHGAGAGYDHAFMKSMARKLVARGIRVVRFNFPYMDRRAETGKKSPPDRLPKLLDCYNDVLEIIGESNVVIGGKSMGGRVASHLADHDAVLAVACLGFPFHPPGKPEVNKGEHLSEIAKPCLILQGERDTFGNKDEFAGFTLAKQVEVSFLNDGDHGFKPRKSSGYTEEQNLEQAADKLATFIKAQHAQS